MVAIDITPTAASAAATVSTAKGKAVKAKARPITAASLKDEDRIMVQKGLSKLRKQVLAYKFEESKFATSTMGRVASLKGGKADGRWRKSHADSLALYKKGLIHLYGEAAFAKAFDACVELKGSDMKALSAEFAELSEGFNASPKQNWRILDAMKVWYLLH